MFGVEILLTEQEFADLLDAAEERGMSTFDLVKQAVMSDLVR